MIEIEEGKFGLCGCDQGRWILFDDSTIDMICCFEQLYAQMLGWV